jgi:hypothetical protein
MSEEEKKSIAGWAVVYDVPYTDDATAVEASKVQWYTELREHIKDGKIHPEIEKVRDSGIGIGHCML